MGNPVLTQTEKVIEGESGVLEDLRYQAAPDVVGVAGDRHRDAEHVLAYVATR